MSGHSLDNIPVARSVWVRCRVQRWARRRGRRGGFVAGVWRSRPPSTADTHTHARARLAGYHTGLHSATEYWDRESRTSRPTPNLQSVSGLETDISGKWDGKRNVMKTEGGKNRRGEGEERHPRLTDGHVAVDGHQQSDPDGHGLSGGRQSPAGRLYVGHELTTRLRHPARLILDRLNTRCTTTASLASTDCRVDS